MDDEENRRGRYTLLSHLTTFSREFMIYVRVISKNEKKNFTEKRVKCLFDFIVSDEEGTTMQVVCFDKVAEKFYDIIKENKVYEISNGSIKLSDRKQIGTNSDYKIILNEHSSIVEKKDNNTIKNKIELTPLSEINNVGINAIINTLCLVVNFSDVINKETKKGQHLKMKVILVADSFGNKLELSVWRENINLSFNIGDVLLLKMVKVGDFKGRNLSTIRESKIIFNPDDESLASQVKELKQYYENNIAGKLDENERKLNEKENANKANSNIGLNIKDNNENFQQINEIYNIQEIIDEMDKTENSNNFSKSYYIKVTIKNINHGNKNFYPGCLDRECQRKLVQERGKWICINCGKSYEKPTFFYSLNIRVKDCSSEFWIDVFGKPAETLLGMSANQYRQLLSDSEGSALKKMCEKFEYTEYYLLVKPKFHIFNGVKKKKLIVQKVVKIDKAKETSRLMNRLKNILFNK